MSIDIQEIEKLLSEKKYDEVRTIISEAAQEPFTQSQTGEMLANVSMLYVDISNRINRDYRDALKDAVEAMEAINSSQSKVADDIDLADVRSQLGV